MGRSKYRQRNSKEKNDRNVWEQDRNIDGEQGKSQGERSRGYTLAMKTNEAFENYYKKQDIVPEGEWEEFMQYLRAPLPSTFRVAGFRAQACELVTYIKGQYFSSLGDLTIDDKKIEPPKCLPWYPDELAWQLNLDRGIIRKNDKLKKLHQFLVSETESGNISRQEAVSMLPPLVLDIKSHHKILDMCAAPGSKTSQLIEMLHADENVTIPDGFVVANDNDNKRCYLMVHQVKRLESPNFMIINHDATQLPNMRLSDDDRRNFVAYDRVLCDVPCSGDGTMRKNPDVWTKWNAGGANNLHHLQCRILKRGVELLAVGGRLVYSTCSFNPVEDEAVVGSMLAKCDGSMRLVDVSSELPGLKFLKGVKNWKVMTRQQEWFDKFTDVPQRFHTQIRPSMFPLDPELSGKYNLENCIRVLPHQQNTGGFFLAVLEKTALLPWMREKEPEVKIPCGIPNAGGDATAVPKAEDPLTTEGDAKPSSTTSENVVMSEEGVAADKEEKAKEEDKEQPAKEEGMEQPGEKRKAELNSGQGFNAKKSKIRGFKEDPFVWLSEEDPIWPPIQEFYKMKKEFNASQLMVRCAEGKKRNLYYTSKAIRTIVEFNEDRVKFINMGVKMFARSDSVHVNCSFRLVNDGINVLYPFIGTRVVEILGDDLCTILSQENPFLSKISEFARNNLEPIDQGGVVFIVKPSGRPNTPNCDIILTGWRGKTSCRSFLRRYERAHYLRLFGHEWKSHEERAGEKAKEVEDSTSDKETDVDTVIKKDAVLGNGDNIINEAEPANTETTGVKTEDVKMDGVKSENVKTKDVKTSDVKTGDVKTKDVKTEDVKTDVKTVDNSSTVRKESIPKSEPMDTDKTDETIK